jgi:hypothetical protein
MKSNPFRTAVARLFGRHTPARPRRRPHLRVEALEDRTNPTPTGLVDQVVLNGGQYVAEGWAADYSYGANITVQVFVINSHGLQFAGQEVAHLQRSDGRPGFAVPIPNNLMLDNGPGIPGVPAGAHGQLQVEVWGIDDPNQPPQDPRGQGQQLQTADPRSPNPYLTWKLFYGDGTIQSPDGGLTVRTDGQFAGVVWSVKSQDGFEYINQHDAGRDEQTAVWGFPAAEGQAPDPYAPEQRRYNPTEGGAYDDISHSSPYFAQPYTHSSLQSISIPASNELQSTTQMALWTQQGAVVDGTGVTDPHTGQWIPPLYGYGTSPGQTLSDYSVAKDVTVGFAGMNNVIHQAVTVNVPAADQLTKFIAQQIAFTTSSLTTMQAYSFASEQLYTAPTNGLSSEPVVESTPDGSHAIAIVSRQLSAGDLFVPTYAISSGDGGVGDIYGNVSANYSSPGSFSGPFTIDNYIVVGTRNSVLASLRQLQADGVFNLTITMNPNESLELSTRTNPADGTKYIQVWRNGTLDVEYPQNSFSSVVVAGTPGNDVLYVDYTNGSPAPAGGLTFDAGGGWNALVAQTSAGSTGLAVMPDSPTATSGSVTVSSFSTLLRYTGVQAVGLYGVATDVAQFSAPSTVTDFSAVGVQIVNVIGTAGSDAVTLTPAPAGGGYGSVAIAGYLSVRVYSDVPSVYYYAGGAADSVNVPDQGPNTFYLAGSASISIGMGALTNTLALMVDPSNPAYTQVYRSGTPVLRYAQGTLGAVTFAGGAENDTLYVDYTHGSPAPAGGLTFDAGGGWNALVAQTSAGSTGLAVMPDSPTATSGSVTVSSFSTLLRYTGVQAVGLYGVATDVAQFSAPSTVTDFSAVGVQIVNVIGTAGSDAVTLTPAPAGGGYGSVAIAGYLPVRVYSDVLDVYYYASGGTDTVTGTLDPYTHFHMV